MVFSNIGDTALVVLIPEADAAVGELRSAHDSSAQEHMPAHVTVLYPFLPACLIDDAAVESMRVFFAAQLGGQLTFESIRSWPGIAWLDPASDAASDLLEQTCKRWPEQLPYGRSDLDPIPHLTIGDDLSNEDEARIRESASQLLPIRSTMHAVDLMVFDGERWLSKHRFDLRRASW